MLWYCPSRGREGSHRLVQGRQQKGARSPRVTSSPSGGGPMRTRCPRRGRGPGGETGWSAARIWVESYVESGREDAGGWRRRKWAAADSEERGTKNKGGSFSWLGRRRNRPDWKPIISDCTIRTLLPKQAPPATPRAGATWGWCQSWRGA